MNLGRVMVIVGLAGVAGLGFAAAQGWRGVADDRMQQHILAGLVPLLVSLLAQGWILFYLIGTRRILAAGLVARGDGRVAARLGEPVRTLVPILLGLGTSLGTFVLGASAFGGWIGPAWHGWLFVVAVLAQSWAAVSSWRALAAVESTLGELEPESAR